MTEAIFTSISSLRGQVRPPSDKSITHRALMLAACAATPSVIRSPLLGEDCQSTAQCLRDLGAMVEVQSDGSVRVEPAAWRTPLDVLDCGNSGTTMRLLAGLIASRPIEATLTGDASLRRRPMKRIAVPLREMGIEVEGDQPPITITGGVPRAIDYRSPVASAQVKSCVLLAGLRADGDTWVTEPAPSRDHTERMLSALSVEVLRDGELRVGVRSTEAWNGFEWTVPGDISSATFWMAAAAMMPGSSVTLREVGVNPTRTGILDVLSQVGTRVRLENEQNWGGEPVADLCIDQWDQQPFEIAGELIPRLIDEVPVLAVLATQCNGRTQIRDARELRVKESDRLARVATALSAMGARVEELEDGLVIDGPTPLSGAIIDAEGDHRLAMAFTVASMVATGPTKILNTQTIGTSYPDFFDHLDHLASQ